MIDKCPNCSTFNPVDSLSLPHETDAAKRQLTEYNLSLASNEHGLSGRYYNQFHQSNCCGSLWLCSANKLYLVTPYRKRMLSTLSQHDLTFPTQYLPVAETVIPDYQPRVSTGFNPGHINVAQLPCHIRLQDGTESPFAVIRFIHPFELIADNGYFSIPDCGLHFVDEIEKLLPSAYCPSHFVRFHFTMNECYGGMGMGEYYYYQLYCKDQKGRVYFHESKNPHALTFVEQSQAGECRLEPFKQVSDTTKTQPIKTVNPELVVFSLPPNNKDLLKKVESLALKAKKREDEG